MWRGIAALAHLSATSAQIIIQHTLKEPHHGISLHLTGQGTFAVWSTCYSAPVILHKRCVEDIGGHEDVMYINMDMAGIAM